MKTILTLSFTLLVFSIVFGQDDKPAAVDSAPPKHWSSKTIFGLNGSQSAFVNWAAGGRNNVSVLGFVDASIKYEDRNVKWTNDLKFALGGLRYIDSTGKSDGLQKTDDKIDLASTFGLRFKKNWYYTATAGFKTQSLNGYAFPNDSTPISRWLAPGYVNVSIGIEYDPSPAFNFYASPLAGKITIVRDQTLANAGSFGVDKATYDVNGLMLTQGKMVRYEFGAYIRLKFQKEIMKNVEMRTKAEFFSNYIKNPQNIDVNIENIFAFKVNKWLSASLQWNLIYDDDIKTTDRNGGYAPHLQFKSVLGLGLSYTLSK